MGSEVSFSTLNGNYGENLHSVVLCFFFTLSRLLS